MCRSIKVLRHPAAPAATPDEIAAAALQFVRKVSGTRKPSKANQAAFDAAVADEDTALLYKSEWNQVEDCDFYTCAMPPSRKYAGDTRRSTARSPTAVPVSAESLPRSRT